MHVETPTANLKSLEDISKWLGESSQPIVVHALISIELPTAQAEKVFVLMFPHPDYLVPSIRKAHDALITLAGALADQSMDPHRSSEVEQLEFEILAVAGPSVTMPGMHVESVSSTDIASSVERWGNDADGLPGSVIGHISIEVYRDTLPLNVREAIAAKEHGEPEVLEKLVEATIISIISAFVTA